MCQPHMLHAASVEPARSIDYLLSCSKKVDLSLFFLLQRLLDTNYEQQIQTTV